MKKGILALSTGVLFALTGCLTNDGGSQVGNSSSEVGKSETDFTVIVNPDEGTQNPGDETGSEGGSQPSTEIGEGLLINKGDKITASKSLSIEFFPPYSSAYMKLTENDTCTGGSYSDFSETMVLNSSKTNQSVPVSVTFRDHDGRESDCYVARIVIDEVGPEIVFSKYPPQSVEEGSDVEIVFTVSDAGSGVDTVACSIGAIQRGCFAGSNTIALSKVAGGSYSLVVQAKDKLGNASSQSLQFVVSSSYKNMINNVTVKASDKVDILFVIDNSGSMAYEQQNMASRVRNFLDVVRGLDWQIGVTTTDPSNSTYGDGRLVQLTGKTGAYVLTSKMDEIQSRDVLSNTLQRKETGSGTEQGIYASYRAVERSFEGTAGNKDLIRSDAQLAVVIISDEDESKSGVKNDPTNFVNYIRSTYNNEKAVSVHSIITRPGDTNCKNTQGYSYGYRYQQISELTGGVIGDVCAADYAAQVQGIAEGVRKTLKTVTLACQPVVDSVRKITIVKDGAAFTAAHTVQGLNLVFDDMLPSGSYQFSYSCLK